MPSHPPTELATSPAKRSLVLVRPTGMLVAMALLLGILLLLINVLKLIDNPTPGRRLAGAMFGLGLLLWAGYRRARGNQPRLLCFDREALHLEPLGPGPGPPAETIPLSNLKTYTYWLQLMRWRGFAQCHLRLKLADGRVLHLADRPGTRPDDPTGTVQLDVLATRLAKRAKTGPHRHPLFFQTQTAQGLLWVSAGAVVAGAVLLGLGHDAGLLLLLLGVGYGATYYLWHEEVDLP